MKIINIFHKDWQEKCSIRNNIIYRTNNDEGTIFLENHYLKIKWSNYEIPDFLFSINGVDYYQNINKFAFYLFQQFTYFNIIDKDNSILYLCDFVNYKIYNNENYDVYYLFEYDNTYENNNFYSKKIIVSYFDNKRSYIFLNNNFIEESLYNELYTIITLNNDKNENKNEIIILNNKDNIFYEYKNINKVAGIYYKYNTFLKLIKNTNEYLYKKKYRNNKMLIYKIINNINNDNIEDKNIQISIIDNLCYISKKTIIFILKQEELLFNYIEIIDYYIEYNIPYLVIDYYLHKKQNSIFTNYCISYYDNIKDLNIINEYILTSNNFILFNDKNIIEYFEINKLLDFKINKYLNNYYDANINNNTVINSSIPKILHFIWVGQNQIPEAYIYYIQSWLFNHKDWKYYFWDDSNIPKLFNQDLYDNADFYAQKADILRYEILYNYGGVYVDCDFLCLKSIDELIENIYGFSAYESAEYVAIGIMGFKKGDLFLKKIIQYIDYNILINKDKSIPNQTGPVFFTKMCNLFIKDDKKYKLFSPLYFYNYTYKDKINNNAIIYNNNNYALHLWGYSWDKNKSFKKKLYNYTEPFLINKIIKIVDNTVDNSMNNLYILDQNIVKKKKRILHIMGIFFSGGIEKFIYYFDKYGNHEEYEYILLCMNKNNIDISTFFSNIKYYSFNNSDDLNLFIQFIKPDLIIDHYSIYLDESPYSKYNNNYIIQIVHSAILYNKNIDHMNFNNCIHLYDEIDENKHKSWLNIKNNFTISLGTEINNNTYNKYNKKFDDKKIYISIIGRVVSEKIPLEFLKKICILSKEKKNILDIHIYGEKCTFLDDGFDYNIIFDTYLHDSNIIYHNYISYDEIHKIYEKTDLLLIPSVYETGSFTCLEAYAHGIPVIARNNYGLQKLIKHNITGYLVNNDDEFINILQNIEYDSIFDNYYLILKESHKYNIVQKISNYENIFNKFLSNKNIIIITSVLNITNNPLSYYHKRSVFTIEERFKQTLKSIKSIKEKMGFDMGSKIEIFLCECSDLLLYPEYEEILKKEVTYYYNFYDDFETRNNVLSKYKGLGELYLMKKALKIINNSGEKYKFIFKLSGRYFLNENFSYQDFNNNYNIMNYWDNSVQAYSSIFYKICFQDILLFINSLDKFNYDLIHGNSFEQCLYKFFNHNILVINKLNISGYLSTEGYLFSI
jgi:mannosyltransferase OCH1-like enzyme